MISQNHHNVGDNVGGDKVINFNIRLNSTSRLILITLIIVPLISYLFHLGFTNSKKDLNKNIGLSIEEIDYRLKKIGDRSIKYDYKQEVMTELLHNFDKETIVNIEGSEGTQYEMKELSLFLEELSFGGHENLSIKNIQNNIINVMYNKN